MDAGFRFPVIKECDAGTQKAFRLRFVYLYNRLSWNGFSDRCVTACPFPGPETIIRRLFLLIPSEHIREVPHILPFGSDLLKINGLVHFHLPVWIVDFTPNPSPPNIPTPKSEFKQKLAGDGVRPEY